MKKMLLFGPLFIFGLTGCIEKNIATINPKTPQLTLPVTIQPTVTRNTSSVPHHTTGNTYKLKTIQGSILTIQETSNGFYFPQYQGKIILLQLFGQDCQYCLKEVPFIKSIQRKYANKLDIIALHAQNKMNPITAQRVMQKFQMNYPVIDKEEANNLLFYISSTYNWNGILPYMMLIKDGVTEYSYSGDFTHQEVEEAVRSLL
jgi:thiol-disulfide isomerase/thioredoxin